jgi:hypothetical protein
MKELKSTSGPMSTMNIRSPVLDVRDRRLVAASRIPVFFPGDAAVRESLENPPCSFLRIRLLRTGWNVFRD